MRWSRPWGARIAAIAVSATVILAVLLGYPAVAEVVGGALVIYIAVLLGRPLTQLVAYETEPGRELIWNVLLVFVVVLALVGVGVMAAAIP